MFAEDPLLHRNDPQRARRLAWLIHDRGPEVNAALFAAPAANCQPDLVEPRFCALPEGVTALKPGQKVEFGVVEGRRGEQALSLHLLEAPPSLSKAQRKPTEQMTVIIEDLIKTMDSVGNGYRRGRYPDSRTAGKLASVLWAVADELGL